MSGGCAELGDSLAAIEGGVLLLRRREGRGESEGRGLPSLYSTSGYRPGSASKGDGKEERGDKKGGISPPKSG